MWHIREWFRAAHLQVGTGLQSVGQLLGSCSLLGRKVGIQGRRILAHGAQPALTHHQAVQLVHLLRKGVLQAPQASCLDLGLGCVWVVSRGAAERRPASTPGVGLEVGTEVPIDLGSGIATRRCSSCPCCEKASCKHPLGFTVDSWDWGVCGYL